jgi:hypothetical protein
VLRKHIALSDLHKARIIVVYYLDHAARRFRPERGLTVTLDLHFTTLDCCHITTSSTCIKPNERNETALLLGLDTKKTATHLMIVNTD